MKPMGWLMVLASGALFGFGLALSTMIRPEVVLSFLRWQDFGLLLVLGGAVVVTFLANRFGPKLLSKPLCGTAFGKHPSELNRSTIVGAAIFGVGWGISGVCPGPAIAGLGAGQWELLISVAAMLAGAWVHDRLAGGKG
jgi:uncharacterized membrane protein YedE/YeeE